MSMWQQVGPDEATEWITDNPNTGDIREEIEDIIEEAIRSPEAEAYWEPIIRERIAGELKSDAELERAARRLCEIRGVDPDKKSMDEWNWYQPNWTFCIPELRAHLEREQALYESGVVMRITNESTWGPRAPRGIASSALVGAWTPDKNIETKP